MPEESAREPQFRVERIDHVELFVPDRYEAAAWYARTLGLRIAPEFEFWAEDPRGPLMIATASGDTKLALFEGTPQGQRAPAGFHRVAFSAGAPAFLDFLGGIAELSLTDHEGRPVAASSAVDHDLSFSIYFSDPFGHRLELTSYDHEAIRAALPAL